MDIKDLRSELFDTIKKVKSGEITPQQANAVSNVSKDILSSAKLELDFIKQREEKDSMFFLSADRKAMIQAEVDNIRKRVEFEERQKVKAQIEAENKEASHD